MTAQQQGCKIRRTWHSMCEAYPEANTPTIARMVARRLGISITTVLGAL